MHATVYEPEPLADAVLRARRAQHLHAETDPEQRLRIVAHLPVKHVDPTTGPQAGHALTKGSHPGQHDPLDVIQGVRTVGDDDGRAKLLQRTAHGAEVADTVIDDPDLH